MSRPLYAERVGSYEWTPDKPAQIVGGERVIIAGWVDHQGKICPFEPVAGLPEVARGIPVSVVSGGC